MNIDVEASLSQSERLMLRACGLVVPPAKRVDWTRSWQAELWHLHDRHNYTKTGPYKPHLGFGILFDAIWLRTESWKRALRGTAILCLLVLVGACLTATLSGYFIAGAFAAYGAHMTLFIGQAPLILLVTFATTSRRHINNGISLRLLHRVQRQLFFTLKCGLVLILSFLISVDVAQPTHTALPFASDLIQTSICVVLAIGGLRWAMLDQQTRCKHCLLELASPSRVGRPSHNLLEWNGTQQMCRKGHGMLSSPELESSWCSHSRWLDQERDQQMLA